VAAPFRNSVRPLGTLASVALGPSHSSFLVPTAGTYGFLDLLNGYFDDGRYVLLALYPTNL